MEFVSHVVKFNSTTTGRERLTRLVQYSSKFANWYLTTQAANTDWAKKCKLLENALSSSRKVMRFGKSLDMLQGALKSIAGVKDPFVRMCLVCGKLNQAFYLLLDHYNWMGKTGLAAVDTKKWGPFAARIWLVTITFNLMRDIYEILLLLRSGAKPQKSDGRGETAKAWTVSKFVSQNKPLVLDTAKNTADVFLPLSILKYVNISSGFEGAVGVLSSIIGIATIWAPALKISPA